MMIKLFGYDFFDNLVETIDLVADGEYFYQTFPQPGTYALDMADLSNLMEEADIDLSFTLNWSAEVCSY